MSEKETGPIGTTEKKEPTPDELRAAEKRRYEKVSESDLKLVVDNELTKIHFEQVVSRNKLRKDYDDLVLQKKNTMNAIGKVTIQMKKLDVEDSEELRTFQKNTELVAKLKQKTDMEAQLKNMQLSLGDTEKYIKEIVGIVPEVLRKKN